MDNGKFGVPEKTVHNKHNGKTKLKFHSQLRYVPSPQMGDNYAFKQLP